MQQRARTLVHNAVQWWEVLFLATVAAFCTHALVGNPVVAAAVALAVYCVGMEVRVRAEAAEQERAAAFHAQLVPVRTEVLLPSAQLVGASRLAPTRGRGAQLVLDVVCGQGTERAVSADDTVVAERPTGAWAGPVYLPGIDDLDDPVRLLCLVDDWVQDGCEVDVSLEMRAQPDGSVHQTKVQLSTNEANVDLTSG